MRLPKLFFVIVFILAFTPFSFSQKKVSLLVAEYDADAPTNNLQHLIKYVFIDGVKISREEIIAVPIEKEGIKGNYVRFDIGKNKIYRNRYVVTGIGNIIDIKNKKILLDQQAKFIAFSGDSVIFHTNDIFKGKYYSIYNLKTEKHQKVENPNYDPSPIPDVVVDDISNPFIISYYDIAGAKSVLVKDAGYGEAQPITGDKVKRTLPLFWIDKRNFLYANFAKSQNALTIYKVGTDKSIEKIVEIDSVFATTENNFFEYDASGNIVYSCGKGRFIIDLKKKKADKIIYENIGNDFFVESSENINYGRKIKFEDIEIGKKWCRFDNAQTTQGYVAFQNDIVVGTERYSQGVAVWNSLTKKWTILKVFELANIVGWVQEEQTF